VTDQEPMFLRPAEAAKLAGLSTRAIYMWDVDVRQGAASTNGNGAYDAQLPTRAHARS
jgi:hypothetical protein